MSAVGPGYLRGVRVLLRTEVAATDDSAATTGGFGTPADTGFGGTAAPAEEGEGEGEEEAAEMTLEEYRDMEKKQRTATEFHTRRAGEGVDDTQWKKTYTLKKQPLANEESDEEYDEEVRIAYPEDMPFRPCGC